MRKCPLSFLPFSAALIAVLIMIGTAIRPNISHSMPYGLYLRLPVWGEIQEGDLVQLESPMRRGYLGSHASDNLLKRVESVASGPLYFVRGESDDSYDSRYFGFVGRPYIKARIVPIYTVSDMPGGLSHIGDADSPKEISIYE